MGRDCVSGTVGPTGRRGPQSEAVEVKGPDGYSCYEDGDLYKGHGRRDKMPSFAEVGFQRRKADDTYGFSNRSSVGSRQVCRTLG